MHSKWIILFFFQNYSLYILCIHHIEPQFEPFLFKLFKKAFVDIYKMLPGLRENVCFLLYLFYKLKHFYKTWNLVQY